MCNPFFLRKIRILSQSRYWLFRSANALFELEWQGDGSVCLRANNGKLIATKRSGHLYANTDAIDETTKYFFYLVNRPILVLKCEQGFVGYKAGSSIRLECNRASYETIQVERGDKGVVYFKGMLIGIQIINNMVKIVVTLL